MIDVKANMKAIQLELGLSNKEVAAKMEKMSEQNYWNWMNLSKKSTFNFILDWCEALHVEVYYVFTYPFRYVRKDEMDHKLELKQIEVDTLSEKIKELKETVKELKTENAVLSTQCDSQDQKKKTKNEPKDEPFSEAV